MGSIDVIKSCLDSVRQISDDVADAIVYLDSGCVEAFQFVGAFSLLLELGVRAVCSLERMSSLDVVVDWNSTFTGPAMKMVVITSRLLSDAHRYILRCLGTHQTIVDCRIFTSISEVSHSAYIDSPLGPDAFHEYEALLRLDYEELVKKDKKSKMGFEKNTKVVLSTPVEEGKLYADADSWSQVDSMGDCSLNSGASSTGYIEPDVPNRLLISVHHFPMIFCALSPRVFILPSEGTIAEACLSDDKEDSLSPGLPAISTGHPSHGDDVPPGATLTAHFLYHLAAKMDLKMEIFSLGDLSKTIGKILTDMSSLYDVGRRNKRSAGLLIIDRSLDLLTPCCHGDSVVDWIVSSLPRRERTSSLHAKNTQLPNKPISVQRAPLDVKIPLGKIFVTEASPTGNDQHLDSIRAFVLGWNSREVKDKSADLNDFKEKVDSSSLLENESGLLNGSLISCDSYKGVNYLEALLDRGIKDGVMLIKKWLLGTLHQDKVPVNLKSHLGLPSSFELLAVAKLLASNQISFIRNKGIIQLAIASVCALSEPYNSHWNAFVSAERILKMSTGDSSQSLSNQIHDFINTSILMGSEPDINNESTQGLISFQDALLIAIIGYTLAGKNFPTSGCSSPFSWEEEHSLKEAVVDAILEMPATKNLRFLRGLEEELEANLRKRKLDKHEVTTETSNMEDFEDNWGSWEEDSDYNNEPAYGDMQLKLELRDRVDHLFKLFHKMSGLKWRNPAFKDLESRFGSDSFSNKGLLYRLLLMALAKYDIPGLEYHSSAVGRFLKSGFGRFGLGQVKPSLGDQDVLLVFVVGGINGLEVREAQEAISESGRPDVQLMIGGTTLLTPDNMFELLLGSSSYI